MLSETFKQQEDQIAGDTNTYLTHTWHYSYMLCVAHATPAKFLLSCTFHDSWLQEDLAEITDEDGHQADHSTYKITST